MLASYPPCAGSSPCRKMCVCESISPGKHGLFREIDHRGTGGNLRIRRIGDALNVVAANDDYLVAPGRVRLSVNQRAGTNDSNLRRRRTGLLRAGADGESKRQDQDQVLHAISPEPSLEIHRTTLSLVREMIWREGFYTFDGIACCDSDNPPSPGRRSDLQQRVAEIQDAEAIVAVINAAFRRAENFFIDRDRIDLEAVREFLRKGKFLVADNGGTLAGCVYVELRGERSYLGLLAVKPAASAVRPWLRPDDGRRRLLRQGGQPLYGFADCESAAGKPCLLSPARIHRQWHCSVPARPEPEASVSFRENVEAVDLNLNLRFTAPPHPLQSRPESPAR